MTSIKLLSATLIAAASLVTSSAFAGTDDGNVAPYQAYNSRAVATTQAPAPAAAESVKQAQTQADFIGQQDANSGN